MHAQKPTRNYPRGTALSAWVKDDEGQSCIQLYNLMDNGPLSLIDSLCGGAKAKSSAWDRSQSARTATEFPMGKVVFNKYLLDTDAFDQMSANRQGFYSTIKLPGEREASGPEDYAATASGRRRRTIYGGPARWSSKETASFGHHQAPE
mgnify:CR=1 FL=1